MSYRYYSVHRPIGPGTIPNVNGVNIVGIHNYDKRCYVDDAGREVWGYVDYDAIIPNGMARQYELVSPLDEYSESEQRWIKFKTLISKLALKADSDLGERLVHLMDSDIGESVLRYTDPFEIVAYNIWTTEDIREEIECYYDISNEDATTVFHNAIESIHDMEETVTYDDICNAVADAVHNL